MLIPTTKESKRYQVKLLDFGIAKDLNNNTHLTQQGMVCGTPEYMSPEQACGDRVSNACDIYALGVVFYEMLAGHLPFRDENRQMVMIKHCQQQPPSIKTISPKLEAIVMRCLKKKQEDRYSSVEDLIAALDEFTHSEYGYQSPLEIKTLLQMRLSQMQLEREALKSQGKSLSKDSSQDAPQPISLNMVKPEDIEKYSKDSQQIKYQPSPIQSKKIINYLDHHSVPMDQQNSSSSFDQPSKIKLFFEESFSEFQERFSDPKTKTMILIFATLLFLMMTGIILNLIFETDTQEVVGIQEIPIEDVVSKSVQNQATDSVDSVIQNDIHPKASKQLEGQMTSEIKQAVAENQQAESKQAVAENKQVQRKEATPENTQEESTPKVPKPTQLGNTPPPLNDAEEISIATTKNTENQPIPQSNAPKKVLFKKYIKKNCDPLKGKVFVDEIDILNAKNCLKWELDLNVLLNVQCVDLLKKYYQRPNDWIMAVRNSDEIQKQVKECTERVPPGMF